MVLLRGAYAVPIGTMCSVVRGKSANPFAIYTEPDVLLHNNNIDADKWRGGTATTNME